MKGRPASPMLEHLKLIFKDKPVTVAEIGVFRGENAKYMLDNFNIEKLYLIDPYDNQDSDWIGNYKKLVVKAEGIAKKLLAPYKDKIVWLRMKSDEAVSHIKEKLDFYYIDGNHRLDYVSRDINNYTKLLKPDGWAGGHDYTDKGPPNIQVKAAVDRYVEENECRLTVVLGNEKYADWWFPKLKIHFIWVGSHPLSYADYLGLKTAEQVYGIKPYLWTDSIATKSEWFLRCEDEFIPKFIPSDWLRYEDRISEIAMLANYVRYKILEKAGGLYLDTDTLCIKPIFDLDLKGVCMGIECIYKKNEMYKRKQVHQQIINNAVIYVENPADQLMTYIVEHCEAVFETDGHKAHASSGPKLITPILNTTTDPCTILPKHLFYKYNYTKEEVYKIWEDHPIPDDMYVLHWWGGARSGTIRPFVEKTVTPEYAKTSNSLYAKVARQSLGDLRNGI